MATLIPRKEHPVARIPVVELTVGLPAVELKTCPQVSWFKFRTHCTINTCKYHSERLISKCMQIDARIETSNFTDSELLYYKFSDRKITVRSVATKRKQACNRVRNILILNTYIEYIRENHSPTGLDYTKNKYVSRLLSTYPLKIKKLRFEQWMLPYMFSMKVFNKFRQEIHDQQPTDLLAILEITQVRFQTINNHLRGVHETTKVHHHPTSSES